MNTTPFPDQLTIPPVNWQRIFLTATVVIMTLGALILRIDYNMKTTVIGPARADAFQYLVYANNLKQFSVFSNQNSDTPPAPDAYRTPGYPLLLLVIMNFSDLDNILKNIYLVQCLLGALLVPLCYLTARFALSVWPSLTSALLTAISPHLVTITSYVLSESLFAFCMLFSIYLYLVAIDKNNILAYSCAGAMFGYSYLVTPTIFFIPWILAALTFIATKTPHRRRNLLVFLAMFSVFWLGFTVRNYTNVPPELRQGRAIGNISAGSYPNFIYNDDVETQYFPDHFDPEQPDYGTSLTKFITVFSQRVKMEPGKYFSWYLFGKIPAFWNWNIFQGYGDVYIYEVAEPFFITYLYAFIIWLFMRFTHPIFLFFVLGGIGWHLATVFRTKKIMVGILPSILLFTIPLYYSLIFIVFSPWPRYSIPLRPELYICAVWTISFLLIKLFKNQRLPSTQNCVQFLPGEQET